MGRTHINMKTLKKGPCNAKPGNCPWEREYNAPHFDNDEEAEEFLDKVFKRRTSTETFLLKHSNSDELIESKNWLERINKIDKKINKVEVELFEKEYNKARRRNKGLSKAKFKQDFLKKHPELEAFKNEKANQVKANVREIERRKQTHKIVKDSIDKIKDLSFSRASSSSYILYKGESLKEMKDYFEEKGFEIYIRPNAEKIQGKNYLVRVSDHLPKDYYKRCNGDINKVWDYTDASFLVTYKEVEVKKAKYINFNDEIKSLYKESNEIKGKLKKLPELS